MNTITERIDKITAIKPPYNREKPPCPESVKIELTARCNFKCTYCARSKKLREQGEMNKHLFARLLLELRQAGVEELGLFYLGESFLVKWLPEAISYAKHICEFPYIFLTTNGSLGNEVFFQKIMASGLDSLKFSFNYASPTQFTDITRSPSGIFYDIVGNIRKISAIRSENQYKTKLYASYIQYDGYQQLHMQETLKLINKHVDEIYALPLYNQANLVTKEELSQGWSPSPGNRGRVGALREPLPCWACFTEGHITYDGLLTACCFDHNDSFTMGDLKQMSFMDAWHSSKFQWLRCAHLQKNIKDTPCENCVVKS